MKTIRSFGVVMLTAFAALTAGYTVADERYIDFLHKLRAEQRFESFDALKQQILRDAEQAREFFRQRS
mgnify:CR=1 FL=1